MLTPRVLVSLETNDLDALGYDLTEDGNAVCARGPARRLARLVEQATGEISFTHAEWNAAADVLNGCADLYDYADSGIEPAQLLLANVQDTPGLGEKWDVNVKAMCQKIRALTPLEGEAVLCAVRWAWRHTDQWDHNQAGWWLVKNRRSASDAKAD